MAQSWRPAVAYEPALLKLLGILGTAIDIAALMWFRVGKGGCSQKRVLYKGNWIEQGGMSDVTTTDPWQMIFDKAGDLADSLLHELPKSKVDAVDIEEQVVSTIEKIATGEVDPRKDWSVIIRPVSKESMIDDRIGEHFDIALRQAVYVRILFEHHMQKIKGYFAEASQPGMLIQVGEEMLDAFACAQQHATAWRLLKAVRDKSYRSQNGNQVKAEKKEEKEVLLRSLIESSLKRLRPPGGWRNHVIASQEVAKDIAAICKSYSFDISMNEDQIFEKIQPIIWKEPRFRKAFNENSEKELSEPHKIRKVRLNFEIDD